MLLVKAKRIWLKRQKKRTRKKRRRIRLQRTTEILRKKQMLRRILNNCYILTFILFTITANLFSKEISKSYYERQFADGKYKEKFP